MIKKLLLALLGLAVLALLVLYFAWSPVLEGLAQNALKEFASKHNNLGWKGLKVRGTTISIDSLEGWHPLRVGRSPIPIPIPFVFSDISASFPFLTAARGTPRIELSFGAYGGKLECAAQKSGEAAIVTATVSNIDIGQHPTIQGFGISSGRLSASIPSLEIKAVGVPIGDAHVELTELSIPQLPLSVTQIPIPALDHVSAKFSMNITPESGIPILRIKGAALQSPLLNAEGALYSALPSSQQKIGACGAEFNVSLSEQGKNVLGSALLLGSRLISSPLPENTSHFKVKGTGSMGSRFCQLPKVMVGDCCITLELSPF